MVIQDSRKDGSPMTTRSRDKPKKTVRLLKDRDREDMIRLFQKTFGHPMGATESERHWEWEYQNGPQGPALVYVCEAEGRVIGAHGNLPLRFKVGGQELLASSSFDSMVDSDYRGLGAFSGVVRAFQAAAWERGLCLSYNFPNENSFPIHIKRMGRTRIEGYVVLRRTMLKRQWLHKSGLLLYARIWTALARARLRGARLVQVDRFDARFDALWEAAKDQVQVGIVRDRAYLDWRFAKRPETEYTTYIYQQGGQIGGYIVLRVRANRTPTLGLVMDVLTLPSQDDIVLALFAKAFLCFIRERVEQVWFGAMKQGPYTPAIGHLFPRRYERPVCGQAYGDTDPTFALDGTNWFISFADTDFQ